MIKKLLSVILASVIALSSLSGCAYADAARDLENALSVYSSASKELKEESIDPDDIEQVASLLDVPAIGESIDGFEVTGLYDFPEKGGIFVEMKHTQSGARLVWVANDDEEKGFNAFYRTKAKNDNGIPHVFEHITLSGSGKYPCSSIFEQVSGGTYITYLNASTYSQMTGYYISSLSDDQLLSVADYYMDGLTDPLALRDSNPLGREAYRYQLYDINDDISVTGAVYNEMESANSSISSTANMETLKQLYPGSSSSYNSGGVRDCITSITLEELQEYYDKYYHPSNMMIVLYGNLDYERYLSFLDENYLSKYEKQEVDLSEPDYSPWTGFKSTVAYHAAEEGAPVEDECIISYGIVLNDISTYDLGLIDVICEALSSPTSPLSLRLENDFPNIQMSAEFDISNIIPYVYFTFEGANEGDEEAIKAIIDEEFTAISQNGLDHDTLESFINDRETETMIARDDHNGTDLALDIGLLWTSSSDDNPAAYLEYLQSDRDLQDLLEKGYFDELFNDYFVDPKCSAMVNTVPKPGLYEKQYAEHEKKLADMKNSMTYWEKKQLIQDTEQFDAWSEKDAATSVLDKISCLDISDLPESSPELTINSDEQDGITLLSYENTDCGYLQSSTYFSASCVPVDKLFDYKLAVTLLGDMATNNHSANEISDLTSATTYEFDITPLTLYDYQTGIVKPYLSAGFTSLDRNVEDSNAIMDEILTETDFTDLNKARILINAAYSDTKNNLTYKYGGMRLQIRYALAQQDDNRKYSYYLDGTDYLEYLKSLTEADDETLTAKLEELSNILEMVINRNGIIYTASGDADAITAGQNHMVDFAENLSSTEYEPVDYAGELSKMLDMKETFAYLISDSSNYNMYITAASVAEDAGFPDNGMNRVIIDAVQNNITYPAFRYDIGAYGGYTVIDENKVYISSYRDPCVSESLEIIGQIPEKMLSSNISQKDIDASIMSVISELTSPETKRELAQQEFAYLIENRGTTYSEHLSKLMREAKSTTEDDFYASAPLFLNVLENASISSSGSKAGIMANKEAYGEIIDTLIK